MSSRYQWSWLDIFALFFHHVSNQATSLIVEIRKMNRNFISTFDRGFIENVDLHCHYCP